MIRFDPPKTLVFQSVISGLASEVLNGFTTMLNGQTRLSIELDVLPKTLLVRIFVQSLDFVQGKIDVRFTAGVVAFLQAVRDDFGWDQRP